SDSTQGHIQLGSGGITISGVSGSLGVGDSTPQAKLSIGNNVGSSFLDNFSEYQILLNEQATAAASYGIGINSNTIAFNSGGGAYRFDRGGANYTMFMSTGGRVAIGEDSSPDAYLDIEQSD